ncbi:MAG: hypothetical protein VKJ64_10935, partial [Leptolyngbyaceae bacterium]|nr:hypothetical protein [Leptolyngbyaceae bacterium]
MVTNIGSEKSENFSNYSSNEATLAAAGKRSPGSPPPPPSTLGSSSSGKASSSDHFDDEDDDLLFDEAELNGEDNISLDDVESNTETLIEVNPETALETEHKGNRSIDQKPKKGSKNNWFSDLPVQSKQLIGFFTSEVISIVGLMGVASFLIISSGRSQLIKQAEAEVSVVDIQYNVKINQMGFGFRGQSDNPAIIRASLLVANGQTLTPAEQTQVQQILQNEITARQIEYATLVGEICELLAVPIW